MNVRVSEPLIRSGTRKSGCACPVALAISTKLPVWTTVTINGNPLEGYEGAVYDGREFRCRFAIPMDVQQRIKRYDEEGVMEPFEFEVDLS